MIVLPFLFRMNLASGTLVDILVFTKRCRGVLDGSHIFHIPSILDRPRTGEEDQQYPLFVLPLL